MRVSLALVALMITTAGCVALGQAPATEIARTESVEPTGRTVELRAWVENIRQEVWPGFTGGFWAYCIEPLPGSEAAVEYQNPGERCSVPGPTLRVKQGDRVIVHFSNDHERPHTIHWHGQILPHAQDGVPGATQHTVERGRSYTYDFIAKREGSLMYHCHVDSQHHILMGLYGMMFVEPQHPKHGEDQVDRHYSLMMSEGNFTHMAMMAADPAGHAHGNSGEPGRQNDPMIMDRDVHLLNGKSFPLTLEDEKTLVKVKEGELIRLSLANIGFSPESWHLHGHDMLVTHKDGKALPAPYWADTVPLLPAERYDVLVRADNPGKWVMHTHITTHVTNLHQYPGGMLTQFVYEGFEDVAFRKELPAGQPVTGAAAAAHGATHVAPAAPTVHTHFVNGSIDQRGGRNEHALPVGAGATSLHLNITATFGTQLDTVTVSLVDPRGTKAASQPLSADAPRATLEAKGLEGTWKLVFEGDSNLGTLGRPTNYESRIDVVHAPTTSAPPPAQDGHAHRH